MDLSLLETAPFRYFFIGGFSFLLVFLGIPSIIHIANQLKLFDNNRPARKSHGYGISRLGGIAVFCSLFLTTLLFSNFKEPQTSNYLLTAFILIFAVGLKDDLWGVNPSTKILIQLITALTVVLLADIRISSMHGIFNIWILPYWVSVSFSTLLIIFLTNSFNLIDGIDGLLGTTTLLVCLTFGIFFAYMDKPNFASMAFTLFGATIGFLKFNIPPAKIFMGDAGSMLIGIVCAILAIKFIELNMAVNLTQKYFPAAPAIAMAILVIPIFDVMRVVILRLLKKISPFVADNNHTHHRLLRLGLSHKQATLVLISFNNLLLSTVIYFRAMGNELLITFLFVSCIVFNHGLNLLINNKERGGLAFTMLQKKFTSRTKPAKQLRVNAVQYGSNLAQLDLRTESAGEAKADLLRINIRSEGNANEKAG
jgi:UDP-GlcNAc:undecaprenyl-phosphate/decaprenyl-phosphate GlcNAc-1-phosphate transferase